MNRPPAPRHALLAEDIGAARSRPRRSAGAPINRPSARRSTAWALISRTTGADRRTDNLPHPCCSPKSEVCTLSPADVRLGVACQR